MAGTRIEKKKKTCNRDILQERCLRFAPPPLPQNDTDNLDHKRIFHKF